MKELNSKQKDILDHMKKNGGRYVCDSDSDLEDLAEKGLIVKTKGCSWIPDDCWILA